MTPLALAMSRMLLDGTKHPQFVGLSADWLLRDVHHFEFTAIQDVVRTLSAEIRESGTLDQGAFLPAPRTWIEVRRNGPEWEESGMRDRVAVLLESVEDGLCRATVFGRIEFESGVGWCNRTPEGALMQYHFPLRAEGAREMRAAVLAEAEGHGGMMPVEEIYATLAIINSPRLLGRKQHMPHRGLEKALARAKGSVGKFPLRAWTELTLSLSAMLTEADGTVHEAHLTGEKCLHFCRAHLRVRNGRLEQVKAHWRGNPALGIKRTRYRLVA